MAVTAPRSWRVLKFSACAYRDIYGDVHTDFYVDGDYDQTKPWYGGFANLMSGAG